MSNTKIKKIYILSNDDDNCTIHKKISKLAQEEVEKVDKEGLTQEEIEVKEKYNEALSLEIKLIQKQIKETEIIFLRTQNNNLIWQQSDE